MTKTKTPIALILSTGRLDIKFWAPGKRDGRPYGLELDKKLYRAVHQELTPDRWRVCLELDAAHALGCSIKPLREVLPNVSWTPNRTDRDAARNHRPGTASAQAADHRPSQMDGDKKVYIDDDGKLLLRPAKVERLITALRRSESLVIHRVLIFFTDRDRGGERESFFDCEPIRTGEILGRWLGQPDLFNLRWQADQPFTRGGTGARAVNVLAGLQQLEGAPYGDDFPVVRPAVRCIDEAIRNLADGFKGRVIVSALGGMTQVKPMILASAELHFGQCTYDYWETEAEARRPLAEVEPLKPKDIERDVVTAAERLAARAHALGRLREGDILGAWGSIAHLKRITTDRAWLDRVEELANFFRGENASKALQEAMAVTTNQSNAGLDALLLRAFQVEAALQGEHEADIRVAEALISTGAFVDLALEHGIIAVLSKLQIPFDPERRRVRKDAVASARTSLKQVLNTSDNAEDEAQAHALLRSDGRLNTTGPSARIWRQLICLAGLEAPMDGLGAALTDLDDFFEGEGLRTLRNQIAHGTLSPTQAQDALHKAAHIRNQKGPLWNRDLSHPVPNASALGVNFLKSNIVTPIFQALGIPEPAANYERIITMVTTTLRAPVQVSP